MFDVIELKLEGGCEVYDDVIVEFMFLIYCGLEVVIDLMEIIIFDIWYFLIVGFVIEVGDDILIDNIVIDFIVECEEKVVFVWEVLVKLNGEWNFNGLCLKLVLLFIKVCLVGVVKWNGLVFIMVIILVVVEFYLNISFVVLIV